MTISDCWFWKVKITTSYLFKATIISFFNWFLLYLDVRLPDDASWLTHYDVQGRGHGVVGAHSCKADAVGGTLNKTHRLWCWVEQQRLAASWSDSVEHWNCDSLEAAAKNNNDRNLPSRMFARDSDLPGWFRCEGSRGTEFPPDSPGSRRRPAASSRRGRGWSRWTCHPLRHTPPWEEESQNSSVTVWKEACLMVQSAKEIYCKGTKFNRLFIKCSMRHPGPRSLFLTPRFCPRKWRQCHLHLPRTKIGGSTRRRRIRKELFGNLKMS